MPEQQPVRPNSHMLPIILAIGVVGLGAMCVVPILIALIFPAFQSVGPTGRKIQSINNMKHIVLALQNYQSRYRSLPPASVKDENGKPLYSWRVLILPFLDRSDIYDQFQLDESWDSPHNRALSDTAIQAFKSPSQSVKASSRTNYLVVKGDGTIFPDDKSISIAEIRDGSSQTIMVVEKVDSDINWAEPRDLDIETMSMTVNDPLGKGISSDHSGGTVVGLADGSAIFLDETIDPESLRALLTVDGGETVSPADFQQ